MPEPSDIEAQVRRHGDWIAGRFAPLDPTELRRRTDDGEGPELNEADAEPRSDRRLATWLAAAAVVGLVGLVGVLLVASSRDDDAGLLVVDEPSGGTWEPVPDLSLGASEVGAEVHPIWTGSEVLLVGAMVSPDDLGPIVAFSPATNAWRTTSQAPVQLPASDIEVVWTGSEVVVTGPSATTRPPNKDQEGRSSTTASGPGATAVGAAYEPATDTWRTIAPAPPGKGIGGSAAWADGRILFWSLGAGVTAYAPASDSWEVLTDAGPVMNSATSSAVWTGDELVVSDTGSNRVAAFAPASLTWRDLPDRPDSTLGNRAIAWTGTVLGVGDVRGPAWMEPDGSTWERPATPTPYEAVGLPGAQVWMDGRFLAWGGPGFSTPGSPSQLSGVLSVDLGNRGWSRLPGPPGGEPVFTDGVRAGDRIFTWGIDDDVRHEKGHGTIRAAISSPGFGTTTSGEAETTPTTDLASGAFCADFHSFLETYQTEVAVDGTPATTDPESADRLLQQMLGDVDDLVRSSPPEMRAAMEHSAERAHSQGPDAPFDAEDRAQAAVIDEWLYDHCGFTTGTPNPRPDDTSPWTTATSPGLSSQGGSATTTITGEFEGSGTGSGPSTTEEAGAFGPPPHLVVPDGPVACVWTRHTAAGPRDAPWVVEYVSSTEVTGLIAYRNIDGSMKPADWPKFCSTVVGPSP